MPQLNQERYQRFTIAGEKGLEHDMENQRNWNDLVIGVQQIQQPVQQISHPTPTTRLTRTTP